MRAKRAILGLFVALAATPTPALGAPPARIAFAADGAIYSMNADGSGRVRLTSGDALRGRIADRDPVWSRDGRSIVFTRAFVKHPRSEHRSSRSRIAAMSADGTGERRVVEEPEASFDNYLVGVTAAGRVVYLHSGYRDGELRQALMAVDLNGQHKTRLLRADRLHLREASISPDGKRILFTRHALDRDYFDHPSLFVMRSDGTQRRRLLKDAGPGAWSPDSRRIALVSVRDRNGITCATDTCDWNGEIYTMRADGSDRVRLTRNPGDDRNPSWSADGTRIAFDSNRNYQGYGGNREIYSIRADGSCLTWLTNGTAFSEHPSWRQRPGEDPAPATCGNAGREPLIEVDLSGLPSFAEFQSYWLGPRGPRGTILNAAFSGRSEVWHRPYVNYTYYDCGEYNPNACGEPTDVFNDTTCDELAYSIAYSSNLPAYIGTSRLTQRRGALVSVRKDKPTRVYVFTGGTTITFSGQIGDPAALVDALRRTRETEPVGHFPEPLFPREMWKRLREAEESYARTHDEEATARELDIPVRYVKQRLRVAKRLRQLGINGRQRCQ